MSLLAALETGTCESSGTNWLSIYGSNVSDSFAENGYRLVKAVIKGQVSKPVSVCVCFAF